MVKSFFRRWFRKENWRNGFAPLTGGLALLTLIYIGAVVVYNTNIIPAWSVASEHAKSTKAQPATNKGPEMPSKPSQNSSNSSSRSTSAAINSAEPPCYKTDFVPYKTTVVQKDYMDKGQTQTFGTGEDGYTEVCPPGGGYKGAKDVVAPLNVTEFVGTGADTAQQQDADAQQLETEKQQRELSAENAGRYAQSTAYQNCVNQAGASSLIEWCATTSQSAYNNAYSNYLSSHPLP